MRRAILVAAVLFALLAKPAVALTGNELRQWCNQQGDPIAEGFCLGYVVGVRDILPEDCVPQTVTNGQLVDVVRKYFEENMLPWPLKLVRSDTPTGASAKFG